MQLKKLSLLFLLSVFALQAQAINFIATNTYSVAKNQIVADEQWVLAALVETDGIFKNDLFITSGNELKLGGIFEGNVWGAASMGITLSGNCERNVRLMGKTVRIDGAVGGNVMALADTVIVGTNAVINGNVRLIASSIIQEGIIHGNATITAARVATLGGAIEGNIVLTAPDVLFARDANIKGNLAYTANKELFPAEGIIEGTLERVQPKAEPLFSISKLTARAMWFLAAFLAGVPFITLFPMTTAMAAQYVRRSPWKCLAVGFLASTALPLFGIMSISSIIGVPLGTLMLASWGIMLYLSRIIMGLVIGTLLLRSLGTSLGRVMLAMALGLSIIYLVTLIPSIGMPVQLMVIWLGMGSFILSLIEKRRLIIQVPQNLKKLEKLRNEQYNPEEK